MKSSLRKLRGFALQRHEQRVDRHRDHSTAAKAADELLAAAQVRAPSAARPLSFRFCVECACVRAARGGGRCGGRSRDGRSGCAPGSALQGASAGS
uniref:Uncharacterized protein n=1 Tax=Aegilops tauschii subsp. strangulata TaxID=200361 RepID=A0A453L9B7_AEGTS